MNGTTLAYYSAAGNVFLWNSKSSLKCIGRLLDEGGIDIKHRPHCDVIATPEWIGEAIQRDVLTPITIPTYRLAR